MRQYETGFLIAPNLSEEETEQIILQMADIVSERKGRMIEQEKWGKRRLAYSLKKFGEAFYVFFLYEGEPSIPQELARRFRQMDTILRYLTLKKDGKENVRKKRKAGAEAEKRELSLEEENLKETEFRREELTPRKGKEEK